MTELSFARASQIHLALKELTKMTSQNRCEKPRWYQQPTLFVLVMALALLSRWQKGLVPLVPLVRNSAGDFTDCSGTVDSTLRTNLQTVLQMRRIPFWADASGTILIRRWCSWDQETIAKCTDEAIRLTAVGQSVNEPVLLHAHGR